MRLNVEEVGLENINEIVMLRMEFIKDLHPEYSDEFIETLCKSNFDYFSNMLEEKRYIGYLGTIENDQIISGAGMVLYYLPPLNADHPRKIGHILNFYTKPAYRGQGAGREMIRFIKKSAKRLSVSQLFLNATQMGYELYQNEGFIEPEYKAMVLTL